MSKPTVLLITCDELRKDALSCYGSKAVETPNIDSLAREGTWFESAYTVSPWCLPARCSILTGLYPHRSGAYSNFRKCALNNGAANLFTELKKAEYKTALFGKCHFAPVPYSQTVPDKTLPYEDFKEYYLSLGIDHLDLQDDKQVSVWFMDDYAKELDKAGYLKAYRDATWNRENQKVFPFLAPAYWHPDTWVGRKAVEYIKNAETSHVGASHFMWVSFSGPHYPFDTPEEYCKRVDKSKLEPLRRMEGEFDSESRIHHKAYHGGGGIDGAGPAKDNGCKNYPPEYWERLRISYHGNMALIDDAVGEIVKAAREKFGDDLLVIFTADHGEMLGNHGLWGKNNCGYEDVLNIPFIISQPGKYERGVSDIIVNTNDIMPTCLSAAGAGEYSCDGKPIEELLRTGGHKLTFAEGEGFICVSNGTEKYIHIRQQSGNFEELHNLKEDPYEFKEFSDLESLARMRGHVIDHFMATNLP